MQTTLNGTLDERLQIILAEYDERVRKVNDLLAAVDSDGKNRLNERKAVLHEQWDRAISDINSQYASRLADTDLSDADRNAVEKEWTEKLAAANLDYQRQIAEVESQLREYGAKTVAELTTELSKLQSERAVIESALNSTDYNSKIAAIANGYDAKIDEQRAALEERLEKLQKQLDAVKAVGDIAIDMLIAKIEAGDAANHAELETMKLALQAYCDELRTQLSARIELLEKTVLELQKALSARINTLENRLKYSLMTDDALAEAQRDKQALADSLANQIAALQLVISDKTARGEDVANERGQLSTLLAEYDEAKNDLDNINLAIELRSNSEFALHKKWIMELQELTASLQNTVTTQGQTIAAQKDEIDALKTVVANLETALRAEMELLKQELKDYTDSHAAELRGKLTDLGSQVSTLHENVMTLATSSYSSYGANSSGNNSYKYSGASNKDVLTDDRDLRTSDSTQINF